MMYQADRILYGYMKNMTTGWNKMATPKTKLPRFHFRNLRAIQTAGNGGCFHASFRDLSSASVRSTVSCNFSASTVILSPSAVFCSSLVWSETWVHQNPVVFQWFIGVFLVRTAKNVGQTGQTYHIIMFQMKV